MGQTPKPLVWAISPSLWAWSEIQELGAQGHIIHILGPGTAHILDWEKEVDIVVAPRAHRMDESLRKWLPEAIAEARRRKYPTKSPGKKSPK